MSVETPEPPDRRDLEVRPPMDRGIDPDLALRMAGMLGVPVLTVAGVVWLVGQASYLLATGALVAGFGLMVLLGQGSARSVKPVMPVLYAIAALWRSTISYLRGLGQ